MLEPEPAPPECAPRPLQYTCTPAWRWVFEPALQTPATVRQSELVSQCRGGRAAGKSASRRFAWARIERGGRSAWFTSGALERLRDKDLLAAELQLGGVGHLAPPTVSFSWDATELEPDGWARLAAGGADVEACWGADDGTGRRGGLVLKPAGGAKGTAIGFVRTVEEAMALVSAQATAVRRPTGGLGGGTLLDEIVSWQGRLPAWVLQPEVRPAVLQLAGGRKYHLRAFVCVRGSALFGYDGFEVRTAAEPWRPGGPAEAQLTNGSAGGCECQRYLVDELPELLAAGLPARLASFITELFAGLQPRMFPGPGLGESEEENRSRRAKRCGEGGDGGGEDYVEMALAAVDVLLGAPTAEQDGELGRLWLLEINGRNPGCPAAGAVSPRFGRHLMKFARGIVSLALMPAGQDKEEAALVGSGFSRIGKV